jgi:C4-dicarboxylate-specific signal transduction histidine kinase
MRQTELVSASRVAILKQVSASIGETNQPIGALVLNAEAALQLLRAQIRKQSGGCLFVSSRTACGLGTSFAAPTR